MYKLNPLLKSGFDIDTPPSYNGLDTRYLKLTGSLAEVTNHSHTVLTDIGTNTHAQIDTYISTTAPATFLKLDQVTPQTVINGAPIFNVGLTSKNTITVNSIPTTSTGLLIDYGASTPDASHAFLHMAGSTTAYAKINRLLQFEISDTAGSYTPGFTITGNRATGLTGTITNQSATGYTGFSSVNNSGYTMSWLMGGSSYSAPFYRNRAVFDMNGVNGLVFSSSYADTTGIIQFWKKSGVNNSVTPAFNFYGYRTTPDAVNGFGSSFLYQLDSSTTAQRTAVETDTIWIDATDATRTADMVFKPVNSGTLTERLRIVGNDGVNVSGNLVLNRADSDKIYLGAGKDVSLYYDGTNGYIKTSEVAASDFHLTTGTAKTLVLDTGVFDDIQFPIASGKVPAANFPTWETFTTNTSAYAFSVDDLIDLQADEPPHGWSEGTAGVVHIHFTLKTAQSTGSDRFAKFTVWLAIADVNGTWTEIGPYTAEQTIATGSAALKHYKIDLGTATLTGYHVGAQLKARVKRIAATGGTEYADDVYITQVGIHVQKVRIGSRTEDAA